MFHRLNSFAKHVAKHCNLLEWVYFNYSNWVLFRIIYLYNLSTNVKSGNTIDKEYDTPTSHAKHTSSQEA